MSRKKQASSNSGTLKKSEEDSTGIVIPSMKRENLNEEESPPEVVLSNKGGPKLIYKGYMYTMHKKQPQQLRWRCVGRTAYCKGSLLTTMNCTKPRIRTEHNHKPDFAAAQVARKRYLALGKPRVPMMPTEEKGNVRRTFDAPKTVAALPKNKKNKLDDVQNQNDVQQRWNRRTTLRKILWSNTQAAQSATTPKTIRIATPSFVKPHIRNIAPAPTTQQQQQQQQPKTLVLKTIPLKVKQVAPTTIKMPPRQPTQGLPQNIVHQQPTEVCLRWNSYHSNMQNSFPSLLDSEQFVDVTLACEGRSLKCHKMILSSCSDYLAELLRENPCQHPIILMKDLKFWEVEALVKFMYRGEVNVAHDKLPQLLNAAEALQVKGLAGPSPSSQSSKPPMLIPQAKPLIAQPVVPRVVPETKETRPSPSSVPTPSSPKRAQKRQQPEPLESRPFTKIRLQRPVTPTSPPTAVKTEPLDIPLSPTEMFTGSNEENSNPASFEKLISLHEEDDPGGEELNDETREINFCELPGPPDLNDCEDQMEFVPTDFLEQEQDIVEETDQACNKDNKEDLTDQSSVDVGEGDDEQEGDEEDDACSKDEKPE